MVIEKETVDNSEKPEINAPEEEQFNADGTPKVTPEAEKEERLYAGKYKTPEELEGAYESSNREATRMAQEIKRLTTLSQQTLTPEKKEAIQDEINDLTKYFDPDTAKILTGYIDNKLKTSIGGFQEQSRVQGEFQKEVSDVWGETVKVYPDAANKDSKLYVRANEILFERKLAEIDGENNIRLLTPFAYRIAVEAAYQELGRQSSEIAATNVKKNQANKIQGKGSKAQGGGKLTYEQYQKLSDEAKDAYDKSNTGR